MDREELLKQPEYWTSIIQLDLFNHIKNYMKENHINRTQLAEQFGVTKGYITQVLNGDFDHRISKMVEMSLKIGYVPKVTFEPIENVLEDVCKQNLEDAWVL